ncbi:hypothetical protein Pelo_18734 [Pelomyxa schiedti]|nr:hypothetical protein Pelo_18734 [Pelomyxa schiedti]
MMVLRFICTLRPVLFSIEDAGVFHSYATCQKILGGYSGASHLLYAKVIEQLRGAPSSVDKETTFCDRNSCVAALGHFLEGFLLQTGTPTSHTEADTVTKALTYYCLGLCYDNREGVEADTDRAIRYWKLSVENGHPYAMNNLAWYYQQGIQGTKQEAFRLYCMSADCGNTVAIHNLGHVYSKDLCGVSHDMRESVRWHKLAASHKYSPSIVVLRKLNINL